MKALERLHRCASLTESLISAYVISTLLTWASFMTIPVYALCEQKDADQTAYPHSLISVFVICSLDSIISIDSTFKILRLLLASVTEQAGFSLT